MTEPMSDLKPLKDFGVKQHGCWLHMRKHWTEKMWLQCIDDWKSVLVKYNVHKNCLVVIDCSCNTTFCEHTECLFSKYDNICVFCDSRSQPFACNPINHKATLHYCPFGEIARKIVSFDFNA